MPQPHARAFLESFDSVLPQGEEADRETGRAQALLEVVSSITLGRDVVVPAPYVLDSATFHGVFDLVWRAVGADDRRRTLNPFKVHLHGAQSFDEQVAEMLRRVGEPHRPFVSSRFPELHDGSWPTLPTSLDELLRRLSDDDRFETLRSIRESFEFSGPPPGPVPAGPALPELARALRDAALRPGADGEGTETRRRLGRALDALGVDGSAFDTRSALRSTRDWPGRGAPARDLVDAADLRLVTEAVDTLYNRVLATSAATTCQWYTTASAVPSDLLTDLSVAQDVAAEVGSSGSGPAASSGFDVVTEPGIDVSDTRLGTMLRHLREEDSVVEGLGRLLRARVDPQSGFAVSLAALQGVPLGSAQHAELLERHAAIVGRLLGDAYGIQLRPGVRRGAAVGTALGMAGVEVGAVIVGGAVGVGLGVGAALGGSTLASAARAGSWFGRRRAGVVQRRALLSIMEGRVT